MEVGDPGAPILHAEGHVEGERRKEPDSVITQPLLMAGQSVQEKPIK